LGGYIDLSLLSSQERWKTRIYNPRLGLLTFLSRTEITELPVFIIAETPAASWEERPSRLVGHHAVDPVVMMPRLEARGGSMAGADQEPKWHGNSAAEGVALVDYPSFEQRLLMKRCWATVAASCHDALDVKKQARLLGYVWIVTDLRLVSTLKRLVDLSRTIDGPLFDYSWSDSLLCAIIAPRGP